MDKLRENHTLIDHPDWLPRIEKTEICFDIAIWDKGTFNTYHKNFYEAERYITHMYHKFGIMPQIGDFIEVTRKKGEDLRIPAEVFVIIGRRWGIDNYEECTLIVIPEKKYLEQWGRKF